MIPIFLNKLLYFILIITFFNIIYADNNDINILLNNKKKALIKYLLLTEKKDIRNFEAIDLYNKYIEAKTIYEKKVANSNGISLDFDAELECGLQKEDILSFSKDLIEPKYSLDYKIGWYLFIENRFNDAIEMFKIAKEKAKNNNIYLFRSDFAIAFCYYKITLSSTKENSNFYKTKIYEYCYKVISNTLMKKDSDSLKFLKLSENILEKTLKL